MKAFPFFNPADCPFEVLGYREDLMDAMTGKLLGTREIPEPDRPLGSNGMKEYTITEAIVLKRGHKEFILKASPQRPKRVVGMIQILCGKVKRQPK
jgi:hypothetical protein